MNIFIHDPYKINLPQEIPRTSQVITSSIPSHIRDTEQGLLYIITWRYLINKKYHAAHAPYSKRIGHKGPEIMKKYNLKIHSSHPQTLILFLLSKGSQDIITLGKKKNNDNNYPWLQNHLSTFSNHTIFSYSLPPKKVSVASGWTHFCFPGSTNLPTLLTLESPLLRQMIH